MLLSCNFHEMIRFMDSFNKKYKFLYQMTHHLPQKMFLAILKKNKNCPYFSQFCQLCIFLIQGKFWVGKQQTKIFLRLA